MEIKEFQEPHIKSTYPWLQDDYLREMFLITTIPTWEEHQNYWNRNLNDQSQKVFAIIDGEKHIGNCGIKYLSPKDRSGELWIYIGNAHYRGKGIGHRATKVLIEYCRTILHLSCLYLHVAEYNIVAQKLYKRLGFITMGLETETRWKQHKYPILKMILEL